LSPKKCWWQLALPFQQKGNKKRSSCIACFLLKSCFKYD
jgi:hypothetical protein